MADTERTLVHHAQSWHSLFCSKTIAKPTWLDRAYRALDESRFAAYGWPPSMTGDVILAARLAVATFGPEGEPVGEDDDG